MVFKELVSFDQFKGFPLEQPTDMTKNLVVGPWPCMLMTGSILKHLGRMTCRMPGAPCNKISLERGPRGEWGPGSARARKKLQFGALDARARGPRTPFTPRTPFKGNCVLCSSSFYLDPAVFQSSGYVEPHDSHININQWVREGFSHQHVRQINPSYLFQPLID